MLKLTLQKKYAISFSLVFLAVLSYVILSLLSSEKEDLTKLSKQNFAMVFQTLNLSGTESISNNDKLTLRSIVVDLFKDTTEGLEEVYFVSAKTKQFIVHRDKTGFSKNDAVMPDSVWNNLEKMVGNETTVDEKVYLTQKLVYKTASGDFFLGYSQLVFSLEHINKKIAEKQIATFTIGLIGFVIALIIIAFVTSILVKRVKILNDATKEVANGVFNQIEVKGNDELSELSGSFNSMIVAVKERLMMAKYVSGSTIDEREVAGALLPVPGQVEQLDPVGCPHLLEHPAHDRAARRRRVEKGDRIFAHSAVLPVRR